MFSNSLAPDSIYASVVVTKRKGRDISDAERLARIKCFPLPDKANRVGNLQVSSDDWIITNMPEESLTMPKNSIFDYITWLPVEDLDFRHVRIDSRNSGQSAGAAFRLAGKRVHSSALDVLGESKQKQTGTKRLLYDVQCSLQKKVPAAEPQAARTEQIPLFQDKRLTEVEARLMTDIRAQVAEAPNATPPPLESYVKDLVAALGLEAEYASRVSDPDSYYNEADDRSRAAELIRLLMEQSTRTGGFNIARVNNAWLAQKIRAGLQLAGQ